MNRTIRANGINVKLEDRGSGPAVVLVHGFPLDHSMWAGQIDGLSGGYRIVAPDLRGFGGSSVREGAVSMDQFADDVHAVLNALEVGEPVVLAGLSMGGYVALAFWRKYASRVRGLILCDTRAAPDAPDGATRRREMADRVLRDGQCVVIDALLGKLFAPSTYQAQPAIVERVRQMMLSTAPAAIAAALRGMAARDDSRPILAGIRVPSLLIVGEHDALTPPDEMRAIASTMPNARVVVIPGAGHMAPMEEPRAVTYAMEGFLRDVA